MKRDPTDPGGEYIIKDNKMHTEDFCAQEGITCSITGEVRDKTITDLVVEDIRERAEMGRKKYGRALLPNDGRDSMRDLYEELLDAVQYLRKEMEEKRIKGVKT